MTHGRSVRLYLVDGTPTGILTAEIMNWTGHVLVTPRSKLPNALQRPEATRTGLYFLVGDDPDQPTKDRVYVGEGDSVIDRLKSHSKDVSKDFWTRACLVTSKDFNLTKAHVRYLESRFVQLIRSADRANVANGNEPALKNLPESDITDMEFFIEQVQVVLPVVGFDFLRPRVTAQLVSALTEAYASTSNRLDLVMNSEKYGFAAKAVEVDGEITVLKGSRGSTATFSTNIYGALRQQLLKEGRLVITDDPRFVEFAEDVAFASPSAAAAVIKNRNTNGRTSWKLANSGQSLKDWQDASLEKVIDPS
ncbi:endonuclease [Rhizobium sp. Leaf371]|uniref:GIY-YIG nuclease family protein n=1 Tax=Rhizobium sp. Leaf371 TaxID=1736355 RepID=UPI000713AB23|nr:GIY-YIG nuclease family protein [Rhizobium sp. Leaf371]KQS67561.1 endonuclease [Rhizobium sp. Leaf371]